jgi:hypothetical protein
LAILRSSDNTYVSGQPILLYAIEIKDKYINKTYVKYDSITDASRSQGVARGTLAVFRDTNVPFRGGPCGIMGGGVTIKFLDA